MFNFFSKKKKEKIKNQVKSKNKSKEEAKTSFVTLGKPDEVSKFLDYFDVLFKKDWVYDYIYQFLISPYWTTPIQDFIDKNCIKIEEGNDEILREIFQAYFLKK